MNLSTETDQRHIVRPEARPREYIAVARLIVLSKKPKGNQDRARKEAVSTNLLKSQRYDLKPSDLCLGKVKSPFRGMEACLRC